MGHGSAAAFWPKLVIGGLLYFALATSTILLTSNGTEVATFWPANAVLAALMMLMPRRQWQYIILAGFVANLAANAITRESLLGPVLFGGANMVELLIFAWGMQTPSDRGATLREPALLGRILLWAGLLAPACSALLGAATANLVFDQPFSTAFMTWMLADSLGLLLFAPFFFSLFRGDFLDCLRSRNGSQIVEVFALQGLVLATAIIVFRLHSVPLLFLLPLPVMLVTFRLGWLGTKLAVMLVAIVVAIATVDGVGPFAGATLPYVSPVTAAQAYLASLLLMQLPVAAALTSRAELIDGFARSERSVRMLAEQSEILLLRLDQAGRFVGVVGAARKLIGRSEAELIGKGFEVLDPAIGEPLALAFSETMDDSEFDQVVEFPAPGPRELWREARLRVLSADQRGGWEIGLTIQDITDRKLRERELVARAHVDVMTGLLNRAGFTETAQRRLGQTTARALDGAVGSFMVMIDVDRFKLINDNLGHAAGDAVLQAVAARLKSHLRTGDIIGRLGGDEFAILLTGISLEEARGACDRLVAAVASSPVALPDDRSVTAFISCGVARWDGEGGLDRLQHLADMALYEAKRGGRNRAVAA